VALRQVFVKDRISDFPCQLSLHTSVPYLCVISCWYCRLQYEGTPSGHTVTCNLNSKNPKWHFLTATFHVMYADTLELTAYTFRSVHSLSAFPLAQHCWVQSHRKKEMNSSNNFCRSVILLMYNVIEYTLHDIFWHTTNSGIQSQHLTALPT